MKKFQLLILGLCMSGLATAQESMMQDISPAYLDRLVLVARSNYPKFKWTAAKAQAADVAVNKAKLSWFDFLQVSYWYTPGNNTEGANRTFYNTNGYQLGFFLNIGNILQKPAVVRLAKVERSAATYDKEVIDMNIEAQVKQRYYAYVRQLNVLKLRSSVQADASDLLRSLKFKFEKGNISFESYNQAQIAYSLHVQEKIAAEADMLIAKSNLEELLGTKLENVK